MKKYKIFVFICLLCALIGTLIFCFNSCHHKDKIKHPTLTKEQKANVRNVHISVFRYEKALFSLDVNHLDQGVAKLYGQVPDNLIAKDVWKNPKMMQSLKGYLSDPIIRDVYKATAKEYPDMKEVEKQLTDAFKIYLTHFPNSSVPKIYTLVPGLDFSMPSVYGYGNNLFINLDMYLGKDYKYYSAAGMPKFISARCDKKYLATDCFYKGMVYKHLPDKTLVTVLDNMIYEGKKLYFTQIMFPEISEQDIIGYSNAKYKWAVSREADVWQYMIEKNILYSKDEDNVRKFVEETPFTPTFGNDSPGRMGSFIGWKIVQHYMHNHPEISLEELMKDSNAQQILTDSYYKPTLKN